MSNERDVNRIVRSWLEDGANVLPDRVLDAVLDQLPATPQRGAGWLARRFSLVNSTMRLAAMAAVVLLAVVVTFAVLNRGGTGGPTPTATPIPTPAPTLPASGQLAPGSYRFDFITFTLPAGWTGSVNGPGKPDSNPPNGMFLNTWRNIATVYSDPCHWQTTAVSVGLNVDAVVAAFVAQKRDATPTPVDVTVDGFSGKEIDLVVPLGVDVNACDGGQYKSFTEASPGGDRYNQGPGQHDLLDILDVNGQILVIKRSFYPANTAADLAELTAIFDSIRITP